MHFQDMLLQGLSTFQQQQVLERTQLENRIFSFSLEDRSVYPPDDSLPWMVLLLLGGFSRKFLFWNNKRPRLQDYAVRIRETIASMKAAQGKKRDPCSDLYYEDLRRKLVEAARINIDKSKGRNAWWQNTPFAVKHGLSWLRRNQLEAVPCDKEGNYCIAKQADIVTLVKEKLDDPSFYEMASDWDAKNPSNRAELMRIAKLLPKHHKWLIECSLRDTDRMWAEVLYTMKTHKPQGEVGLRLIHSSSRSSMKGPGKVLNDLLNPAIKVLPTILESSKTLVEELKELTSITGDDIMMRVDIKDFYLEGDHELL